MAYFFYLKTFTFSNPKICDFRISIAAKQPSFGDRNDHKTMRYRIKNNLAYDHRVALKTKKYGTLVIIANAMLWWLKTFHLDNSGNKMLIAVTNVLVTGDCKNQKSRRNRCQQVIPDILRDANVISHVFPCT
ncbi:hypothetical protein EDS67_06695 [candidate division KSB1 bacterium]|nr:MAG: hypothetical protein EDS67_06695 [candidate division KSB1 bacterium]MBC6949247.1 hypothetical protein [candidate division KSB1 bacterium]MCE7941276.1 hypothetical protein [Chlorobi bacterium CHB1]